MIEWSLCFFMNALLLDKSFVGRELNEEFLNDLPEGVDPCGENGEFHTFVYDGPGIKNPVDFKKGEKYLKNYGANISGADVRFWYQEILN
jgi:diphthamide synthase (EF-2-diphthine--ammonia ligase)